MFENLKIMQYHWKNAIRFNTLNESLYIKIPIDFLINWLNENSDNVKDLDDILKNAYFISEFVKFLKKELELD